MDYYFTWSPPKNEKQTIRYLNTIKKIELNIKQLELFTKVYNNENIIHRTIGTQYGIDSNKKSKFLFCILNEKKCKKYNISDYKNDKCFTFWIFILLFIKCRIGTIKQTFSDDYCNYILDFLDEMLFISSQ